MTTMYSDNITSQLQEDYDTSFREYRRAYGVERFYSYIQKQYIDETNYSNKESNIYSLVKCKKVATIVLGTTQFIK